MKTLTEKVDRAQSITRWCWRPPTNRSGKESLGDQKEKPILTETAGHAVVNCSGEVPEHLPRTGDHEAEQWRWRF